MIFSVADVGVDDVGVEESDAVHPLESTLKTRRVYKRMGFEQDSCMNS